MRLCALCVAFHLSPVHDHFATVCPLQYPHFRKPPHVCLILVILCLARPHQWTGNSSPGLRDQDALPRGRAWYFWPIGTDCGIFIPWIRLRKNVERSYDLLTMTKISNDFLLHSYVVITSYPHDFICDKAIIHGQNL